MSMIPYPRIGTEPSEVEVIEPLTHTMPSMEDLKEARLNELRAGVEQDLQLLIQQASEVRKSMDGSKTSTKKQYYSKKFKKINDQVMRLVGALQRLNHAAKMETKNETPESAAQ